MKLGAEDYIVKPFDMQEFLLRIQRVIEKHGYKNGGRSRDDRKANGRQWIGNSLQMRQISHLIEKIAPTPATVLITGKAEREKKSLPEEFTPVLPLPDHFWLSTWPQFLSTWLKANYLVTKKEHLPGHIPAKSEYVN